MLNNENRYFNRTCFILSDSALALSASANGYINRVSVKRNRPFCLKRRRDEIDHCVPYEREKSLPEKSGIGLGGYAGKEKFWLSVWDGIPEKSWRIEIEASGRSPKGPDLQLWWQLVLGVYSPFSNYGDRVALLVETAESSKGPDLPFWWQLVSSEKVPSSSIMGMESCSSEFLVWPLPCKRLRC